ncbi:MAG: chaperone protein HscA [Pseudomonadota bacterium]
MALLQIAEPGQSTLPHERRHAVGIDLGTTHSLVAAVRSGVAEILPDGQGRRLLPSVVHYAPSGPDLLGEDAHAMAAQDPQNTIVSVKRLMGRGLEDAQRLRVPYLLDTQTEGMVRLQTAAGAVSPVEVSAELLRRLRHQAEETLGDSLVGAVITVPAYFDDAQRQATKDAAQLAGLNVLRLINEPTAAALAYGLESGAEGVYAVYDLGGGTFDISILRLTRGVFEVVATGGDPELGGDDFDAALAIHWLGQWGLTHATVPPAQWQSLLRLARGVKEALSACPTDQTKVEAHWVYEAMPTRTVSIDREGFGQLTGALVGRTIAACQQALADAGLPPQEIQGVVLVGGSTRLRNVQQAVEAFFGQSPKANINPDEVVAIGAALQANLLAGNRADGDDWLLLDVLPLSLGLETMGGLVERIIPRNSPIPVARAQDFTTFQDGQTGLSIHVVQGERELVGQCRSLAKFDLRGIPPMAAGAARIRVSFQVDADGLLSVTAQEQSAGVTASITVRPSYGLDDGEVARMLQEAFDAAAQDRDLRALAEAQVDAEQLLRAVTAALAADGDLLSESDRHALELAVDACRGLCGSNDLARIRAAVKALNAQSEPFAALRMNRAISQALSGQSVHALGVRR